MTRISASKMRVISVVQALDPNAEAIMAGDAVKLLSQGGTFRVTKLASTRY